MLKKVRAWGHKGDRDWVTLVNQEFTAPFRGTDFIHGYTYKSVKPAFDIRFDEIQFEPKGAPCVKRLRQDEMLKLTKFKKIWNFLDF